MRGVEVGDAAMQILDRREGPTLAEARAALSHMDATKEDLWHAVAYLALQANTYRAMSNRDAELAVMQIESIVHRFRERQNR